MRISKPACAIVAIVLALHLILSAFMVFSNSANGTVDASIASTNVGVATGYGDLLQYEWPQIHGDSAFTRFSAGPAPEAPDILWKTTIKGIQSYVAAFNGKVFVTTTRSVIALDKDNGGIMWNTTLPASQQWPAVYKIDDTHFVVGKYCLDTQTGRVLWASGNFSAKVAWWAESVYSPEEKAFYTQGQSTVQAWNFSDTSKPPALIWEAPVPGSGSSGTGIQYGDGKVFPGSFEPLQMALDAKTGKVIWDTETKGAMTFSGSYYKGRLLKAGEHDNIFYCFNATTGKILWTFNPGTEFGYWASGCAAAYGKVYELNKDGYFYALDVNTGKLVWKYKGPGDLFWPGWPVVADGKVYATTGQAAGVDPITGEYSKSEFACLDAYTGNLLWKLPIEAYAPRESTAIAYGNLYLIPGYIEINTMNSYTVPGEVWAIGSQSWSMWRHDPEHTGTGQSGPTNLTLRWKFTAGGAIISSPSVVDGRVYVGSVDKNLYCLDALSGRLVWNFTTGSPITSSPAVADGKVYIGPDDGYVYCLHAKNGSQIWKSYAGGYIPGHFNSVVQFSSSPAVVGDRVYVGSLDTNLYCFDANSGKVIWTYKTSGYICSSPAVVDNAVYFTSQTPLPNATLYKVNANNASLIWKTQIPYQLMADRGTDMMSSPTVADGIVFTAVNKQYYYGINATSGKIKWTYQIVNGTEPGVYGGYLVGSVAYHDGKIFLIDGFFITCVDANTGQPVLRSWLGGEIYISPSYADGKIYAAINRRAIYVLNATTGYRLSYFETGSACRSSPALYEGMLYIGNDDWNIYCLVDASFPIINTSIVANLNKDTINLTKAESVTVTGQIKPGIAYTPITVTFVKPGGAAVDLSVTANEEGSFTASYTPDTVGNWTITAWYSGAEYPSHAYTYSCSADLPLKVVESQQSTQPPASTGIPVEYVYAAVAIVAIVTIVIVVAAGYMLMKKRKK
jgi:outer membrane protein assembly factor BamB